jgi:hypothetical protein
MSVLQNILPYVAVKNARLNYVETTATDYIFQLNGYKLIKNIIDKNSGKVLKEFKAVILLDINQQNIAMYDYEVENYGDGVLFKLPISNFPTTYKLNENDDLHVTGTFAK